MSTVTWSPELHNVVKRLKAHDLSSNDSLFSNCKTQELLSSPIEKEAVYKQFSTKATPAANNPTVNDLWG